MHESETSHDPDRLGEVHDRLMAIDAYTAPSRAAQILVGLGFDEAAQHRPLDSFSGGWRMRVALASLLFSQPDLLLLDEPSNHLDLEAVLWLEDFLQSYPATILIVSHERDFLNNVVDHILHLERGKLWLYPGGYDLFERQRAERQAQIASARQKQQAEREKLQDYVARNSARASTAKQAQSRAKALARMQPIAELVDDPVAQLRLPQLRRIAPAADHARPRERRLWRDADPQPPQPAPRPRRPDRAAGPQRQRQDHARAPARRATGADGRGDERQRQDARRLFHAISGRGTRRVRNPAPAHDRADEGRDARRGARPARPVRLFGRQGDDQGRQIVGRRARAARARADHPRRAAHADPRRADQPPRRRRARGADPGAQPIYRRGRDRQPRPPHAGNDRRPAGAGRQRHREGIRRQPRRLYRVRAGQGRVGHREGSVEAQQEGSAPRRRRSARGEPGPAQGGAGGGGRTGQAQRRTQRDRPRDVRPVLRRCGAGQADDDRPDETPRRGRGADRGGRGDLARGEREAGICPRPDFRPRRTLVSILSKLRPYQRSRL